MKPKKTLLLAFPLLATTGLAHARDFLDPESWAANIKYFALTYHPDGGENEGYPRQLDDQAYWVLQVGLQGDLDYKIRPWLLARASTALYKDCADVWAGFTHVGVRLNWDATEKLSLRVGIGPTFLWRQNWLGRVKGYQKDSFFGAADSSTDYQKAFLWYGGDVEAEWRLNQRWSAVASVVPGYPEVITSAVGLRAHW